ncbi:hypothetical protein [Microtetraspora sp. NBRC 16547]|nr:hypothetical protein [Microtetraspora sp. NBRC 16547]GLW99957.1 hypothetical protein Misp02_40440 [Microtetraspora sp. NBRC 16547]
MDGDELLFNTDADSVKGRDLAGTCDETAATAGCGMFSHHDLRHFRD